MRQVKPAIILFFLVALLVIAGCKDKPENNVTGSSFATGPQVTFYKSESCGCCSIYAPYLEKEGFNVKVEMVEDMSVIKQKFGIPPKMQSCHTYVVEGYVVEGHVPVEALQKLLTEKPAIKGIILPGMPAGAPGMGGAKAAPFAVYALNADGSTSEFMSI